MRSAAVDRHVLFFPWAGGITASDIVTLGQRFQLELEGLSILYMQVLVVVVGAPVGCWVALRRQRAPAAGATVFLIIPLWWLLEPIGLRHIATGPADPLILPFASVGAAIVTAAAARS